ncbi:CBS domain-containing protein [Arenimonas sp. GDDSR-1]|uniref:CBS domain-containing protein n=1 Tax=Arenimonas sp. GDDSR-1 TaxID=2950125 RepID=UPI0026328000|nr:CBS domain-containing protein [Arenimonas sp. GDDSR-1]
MTTVAAILNEKADPSVLSLPEGASVLEAIALMAERHVGSVLVTRDGGPVGILTERDYARKVILRGRSSADTAVSEIMSEPLLTVTPGDSMNHCMALMTTHRIRHLPVIDGGRLAGMVSIGDLLKSLLVLRQREIEQAR